MTTITQAETLTSPTVFVKAPHELSYLGTIGQVIAMKTTVANRTRNLAYFIKTLLLSAVVLMSFALMLGSEMWGNLFVYLFSLYMASVEIYLIGYYVFQTLGIKNRWIPADQ